MQELQNRKPTGVFLKIVFEAINMNEIKIKSIGSFTDYLLVYLRQICCQEFSVWFWFPLFWGLFFMSLMKELLVNFRVMEGVMELGGVYACCLY